MPGEPERIEVLATIPASRHGTCACGAAVLWFEDRDGSAITVDADPEPRVVAAKTAPVGQLLIVRAVLHETTCPLRREPR